MNTKKGLVIGLPLFYVIQEQEKVALIAHEMAHFVNGDTSRGVFIGSIHNSIVTWYRLLRPDSFWPDSAVGLEAVAEFFGNVCMYVLSLIPESILYFYYILGQQDSQRAEYYADLLGSSVSGRTGFKSMFDKLEASYLEDFAVQKASLRSSSQDFLGVLKATYESIPKREYTRLHRMEELYALSIDSSHPPTYLRRKAVSKLGSENPKVKVDAKNKHCRFY